MRNYPTDSSTLLSTDLTCNIKIDCLNFAELLAKKEGDVGDRRHD